MKAPFKYSKSNKIYMLTMLTFWLAFFVFETPEGAYAIGRRMGSLIGFWLFPTVIAWLFWLVTRRNPKVLSATFNVVLTLIAIGHFTTAFQDIQKKNAMADISETKKSLTEKLADVIDDPDKVDDVLDEYYGDVNQSLNKITSNTRGIESEIYKAIQNYVLENQRVERQWKQSLNAVADESIINLLLLKEPDEAKRQLKVLDQYLYDTQVYKKNFFECAPKLELELSSIAKNSNTADEFLKGLKKTIAIQEPIVKPLMEAYIDNGMSMVSMIKLLDANPSAWTIQNDELIFEDDSVLELYNIEYERQLSSYEKVIKLTDELIPLM